jgi:hypothetical protein
MASRRASGNWEAYLKGYNGSVTDVGLGLPICVSVVERLGPQLGMHIRRLSSRASPPIILPCGFVAEEPSSLLQALTAGIQSTFFGRTASMVEEVTPSNSLPGDESRQRELSSPRHTWGRGRWNTGRIKPAPSNVQERVPSLPLFPVDHYSHRSTYDGQQAFSGHSVYTGESTEDNRIKRTASYSTIRSSIRSRVYSNQANPPPPPLEPASVDHAPFHGPRPLPEPSGH